jgi:hypothetical protein
MLSCRYEAITPFSTRTVRLGGVALVVDVERAALAGLGGVVDDGDEVGGDLSCRSCLA